MEADDSQDFRDALGCFPTGVTVVTTRNGDGEPVGLTATASVQLGTASFRRARAHEARQHGFSDDRGGTFCGDATIREGLPRMEVRERQDLAYHSGLYLGWPQGLASKHFVMLRPCIQSEG